MFQEEGVMWSLWVSQRVPSLITQIHPGMKDLMCWVKSMKPSLWEAPQAAGERCWKLSPELNLSESNPNSQLPPRAFCSSLLPQVTLEFRCLRGRRQQGCADFPEPLLSWEGTEASPPPGTAGPWHSPEGEMVPAREGHEHRPSPRWGSQDRVMLKRPRLNEKGSAKAKTT